MLTIQTDNGGGPMTCHLIEDRLEVRQRDGEFDVLRNAELIPCPTMVWTEQGVVDWLRTTASEALPAHLDSSREEL
ncbi:MAG: hypothetical protein KC912_05865 [Proteobacteria bacterium]|nr:hypothetical protein [Pseudomonadota bacterium]